VIGGLRLKRGVDALDSWIRVTIIFLVVVLNGALEETLVLRAEFMMLLRWSRDVVRYQLRWVVQEKLRRLVHRPLPSVKE
jgi:hypothetical protein